MTEEERRQIYTSLLRGLGEECQKRMCASDQQHDWGPWVRTVHHPDIPNVPLYGKQAGAAMNMEVLISSERRCECCGKTQRGSE